MKIPNIPRVVLALIFISTISLAQNVTTDFTYPLKTQYHASTVESSTDDNDNIFEKVVIDGFDSKIPFYIIYPKEKSANRFVILLHGLTGSKENWIDPISSLAKKYVKLKDSLLMSGYSVIIPDAKYHGERSYEANFASPLSFFSSQDAQSVRDLFSSTVKDVRIIMDYVLLGDSSATFNVVGYSMGGVITILLNSVDDRLNRVVVCVAPLDAEKASRRIGMNEEKSKTLGIVSPNNYATLQKAPITLLMGTQDGWYSKEDAQDFFDEITVKDKSLKFYESGHYLPDEFVGDAIKGIIKQ